MYHTYRCILDIEEDVIRDIKISDKQSLQDLHSAIVNAFGFSSNEMAAFYRTDDTWEQGEEIPLIDMSDAGVSNEMKDYKLSSLFHDTADKMLYVYDFLNLWTFFIELRQIEETTEDTHTQLIFSTGKLPHKAPEKHFESTKTENDFEDELADEFSDEFGEDFGGELDDDYNIDDFGNY